MLAEGCAISKKRLELDEYITRWENILSASGVCLGLESGPHFHFVTGKRQFRPASLVRILSQEVHSLMALCHLIVPETNKYNLLVVILQEKLWHRHIFTLPRPTPTPKMHAAV